LYAFFIHFNALFLVYMAVLGLSFYLLVFGIAVTDRRVLQAEFDKYTPVTLVSGLLWLVAGMFSFLWLSQIIPATVRGRIPASLEESGLPTNPVYILDLALLLPGMIITGILLKRRNPIGYFLAAPLLVNTILLGIAILGMMAVMAQRGVPVSIPMTVIMTVLVLLELAITVHFLNHLHAPQEEAPAPTKLGRRWMFGPADLSGRLPRG
jgi:hypothetical protein